MIRINTFLCELCGTCVGVCSADAIVIEMNTIRIDENRCIFCKSCVKVCPVGAVEENNQ